MKKVILLISILFFSWNFSAQEREEIFSESGPEGSWTVTKKYDAQGNLIAKDSIYSFSSFNEEQISPEEAEKLWKEFSQNSDFSFFFEEIDLEDLKKRVREFDKDFFEDMFGNFDMENFQHDFNLPKDLQEWLNDFDLGTFDFRDDNIQKYMREQIEKFQDFYLKDQSKPFESEDQSYQKKESIRKI